MQLIQQKRNFGLDLLRAIAISLVLISHCTLLTFPDSTNNGILLIRIFGAIGVDLFFVLSGYLIGGLLLKNIELNKTEFSDLKTFWVRRWLRTLPNYFLILIFLILFSLVINQQLPDRISHYFVFFQNFNVPHPNFFTEAWSLSVEEYAYLFLPLVLFSSFYIFKNFNKKKLFLLVTICTILLLLLFKIKYYLVTNIPSYAYWSSTFRKTVLFRIDSIYVGFVLTYLLKYNAPILVKFKNMFAVLGVSLLFFMHYIIYMFNIVPDSFPFFYVFIYLQTITLSIALVFPFCVGFSYNGIFKKTIYFLSVHSYSIYLINYSLVLLSFEQYFDIEELSIFQKIAVVVLYLLITIIFSRIIYKFFELPILLYRDSKFH